MDRGHHGVTSQSVAQRVEAGHATEHDTAPTQELKMVEKVVRVMGRSPSHATLSHAQVKIVKYF